jgi:hypothetical protein
MSTPRMSPTALVQKQRADARAQQNWEIRGSVLAQSLRLQQFVIADWIVEGIEQFGATAAYDYAEAAFPQYARATIQSWVTVAKHFPASIRIESGHLTFGHYQVAQGSAKDSSNSESNELQAARELVWLRKADEHKMSVSVLRDAINRAFELRQQAFFDEHPDLKPTEPEPEPKPKSEPIKKKDAYGAEVKEFKTPWLTQQTRWGLDELARARRVRPEQLAARIVQDFLDAHSDEIGDAEAAANKRQAEVWAQMDVSNAAEKVQRELAAKERVEKAEREQQQKAQQKAAYEQKHREEILCEALVSVGIDVLERGSDSSRVAVVEIA